MILIRSVKTFKNRTNGVETNTFLRQRRGCDDASAANDDDVDDDKMGCSFETWVNEFTVTRNPQTEPICRLNANPSAPELFFLNF
jgi:hypothetical protein